jgi:hypothetical protein
VQLFEELAAELHSAWNERGRDELAFPTLAQNLLDRFQPASAIRVEDVFGWLVAAGDLPRQFDPQSSFGNFSLTVAARDDFHIDLLVWTDSTTAIHQHTFSGAFHVLLGSSLHTLWSFEESRRWSDRLKRGKLRIRATEWLRTGTTRAILPGAAMIHSLFHIESPSVTVVVRTPSSAVVSPQLTYERSGLAYDTHLALGRVEKVRQLLCLLWTSGHPERIALSDAAISGLDPYSAVRVLASIRPHTPAGTQERLIDMVALRDPELAELLRDTVIRKARDRALVELRKLTADPRHRLLLALVLNLPDRGSIDSVLRQIVPGELPEEWLWDTIRSMRDSPGQRLGRENVLGFALNKVSEEALRMLLRGHSIDDVAGIVAGHEELMDDARALCSTLAAQPLLGPLLGRQLATA